MGGAQHACMELSKAATSIIIAASILWSQTIKVTAVTRFHYNIVALALTLLLIY